MDIFLPIPGKRIKYILVLVILFGILPTAFSQTIHVAASGNDISGDGSPATPYATITKAISVAFNGNTINVGAGTYAERIEINKVLTINGPNAGKAGNDVSRTAEAKIIPPNTDLGGTSPALVKFTTGSSGSTFDGFEVNGDNPSLSTSGIIAGGVQVDAAFGIRIENTGGVTIKNNLVQNYGSTQVSPYPYSVGIIAENASGVVSGIIINKNYIKNINQPGVADLNGIMILNNTYAQITQNRIENVRQGIQFLNGFTANPDALAFPAIIEENDIYSYRSGVYYNLQYNSASPWMVRNNTIRSITAPSGNNMFEGIRVESIRGTVKASIVGNIIIGNEAARLAEDASYKIWGIGFKSDISTTGAFNVKDNDISLVKHGIVYAGDAALSISTKIKFNGGNIHNVSGDYVHYETLGGTPTYSDIKLPTTKLDGKTGKEYTDSELAAIKSSKITDKDDNAQYGRVSFIFSVKNITSETYYSSIQEAIDDSETQNGDVLDIDPGTHTLSTGVNVTKELTIQGNSLNLNAKPIITGVGGTTNKALFYVTAPNVTIQNLQLRFFEQNANAGASTTSYGIRTGVNGTFNNLKIFDNIIEGTNSTYVFNSFGISTGAQVNVPQYTDRVTIQRNSIRHTVSNNAFGRAIRTWFTYGTIGGSVADKNDLRAFYSSIQTSRPGGLGEVIITHNTALGKISINGLSAGVHKISNNTVTSGGNADAQGQTAADRQPALIEIVSSPIPGSSMEVSDNILNDFKLYGLAVYASHSVSILRNTFNPLANATGFTHFYFDTKTTNSDPEAPATWKNLTIKGNQFNSSGVSGGTGLLFSNTNSSASLKPLSDVFIGGAGSEANTFSASLAEYIKLSNTTGSSELIDPWTPGSVFYGGTTATTALPFSTEMDASQNIYGSINPSSATNSDLYALETKINHGVDNGLTGFVTIKALTAFVSSAAETSNAFAVVPDANYSVLVKSGTNLSATSLTATKDLKLDSESASISLTGLTMNGAGKTLTLSKPVNISGSLNLSAGVITSSTSNLLSVSATATLSSPVNDSYVDGPVSKAGGGNIIFPIGKNGISAPIEVTGVNANNTLTAEYFKSSYTDVTNVDVALTNGVSRREYWSLSGSNSSHQFTVTLWSTNETASGIVNPAADLVVAAYNGTKWNSLGASSIQSGPVKVAATQTTSANERIFTFGATAAQYFSAPNISSITLPANATYKSGDILSFKVNFSTNANVTGSPQLLFSFLPSTNKTATYISGSGTNSLLFNYTIQAGDLYPNGVAISSLSLNSGTIVDDLSTNADLTIYGTNSSAGVKVDAIAPVISLVSIPNEVMNVGSTVTATITTTSDLDTYAMTSGSIAGINLSNFTRINSTTYNAVFSISNGGNDLAASASIPVSLSIRDGAGNQSAAYTTAIVQNADLIDANIPVITSVTVPSDGLYFTGQNLNFSINYSENVTVTGTSLLSLNIGNQLQNASYISGSGTSSLLFRYSLQNGDSDADGIAINALSGGTIKDIGGNTAANTLNPPSTAGITVDAAKPVIAENQLFNIAENSLPGTSVGTVTASDQNTLQNWTIVSGNLNNAFAINSASGLITVNSAVLNFESLNTYTLSLTVSDGFYTSVPATIQIKLTDMNELAPIVTASQTFNVNENSLAGAVVGTVKATDGDSGTVYQNWTITNGNLNTAFEINSSTGVLIVKNPVIDFESLASYSLTLTVSDGVFTSAPETIEIKITDVNALTPVIAASQTFSIDENSAAETIVGTIKATDGDPGTVFQNWTITGGNEKTAFAINPVTGVLTIKNAVLDFELLPIYTLTLTVSDGFYTSLPGTIQIKITDVNELAPAITASQTFSIDENSAAETVVGAVKATDGEAGTVFQNWTITGGNEKNAFAINPVTGVLTVKNPVIDFEQLPAYTLTLTVSDGVFTSDPATVTVKINNLPEAPSGIRFTQESLYENRPSGVLAGTLSSIASDPGTLFTYTLVSGSGEDDNSLFTIDGNKINTAASFNFELKSSFKIRVRSTTQHNKSTEEIFTITLRNVNEVPTLNAIANQLICFTNNVQTIPLSGISAGEDLNQTVNVGVLTDRPELFDVLAIRNGNELQYQMKSQVTGVATITINVRDNGDNLNGGVNIFSRSFTISGSPFTAPGITSSTGSELTKGLQAELTATGGATYVWANAEGIIGGLNSATLTVRPSQTTTYKVTVSTSNGCSADQSITITVKEDYTVLNINNLMTPNGDGINDNLVIKNIDLYPGNTVKIYDAAGRMLYSKQNYTNEWDGSLNGSPLEPDTYFYIVDFGPNRPKLKGFVSLVK